LEGWAHDESLAGAPPEVFVIQAAVVDEAAAQGTGGQPLEEERERPEQPVADLFCLLCF
jgi:hypothetical protein